MTELTLSDFLDHYKNPDSVADYQYYYSRKKEFAETRGAPSEKLESARGSLYTSQLEFLRFLREANNTCVLMADPGTGKTCQLVALAEYFRTHPGRIKHVFFLTGGPQIDDFKRQLACVCTVGIYDKGLDDSINETQMKSRLTRNMSNWYTATTYGEFVKDFKDKYNHPRFNAMIRKKFANTLIFCDEVQKVKMANIAYREGQPTDGIPKRVGVYAQLWRIFHLIPNAIKVISSARIVENYPDELGFHLNLVNPLDQQIYYPIMEYVVQLAGFRGKVRYPTNYISSITKLFPKPIMEFTEDMSFSNNPQYPGKIIFHEYNIDNVLLADEQGDENAAKSFKMFLNGKVFYVRALDTGIVKLYPDIYEVPDQKKSQIRLKRLPMSEFQQDCYLRITANDTSAAYVKSRQAITWVYPDGTCDSFEKYIRIDPQTHRVESRLPELTRILNDGVIFLLSSKAAYLCDVVAKAWQAGNPVRNLDGTWNYFPSGIEIDPSGRIFKRNGKIYIYTDFDYDGGAYQLGLALQYGINDPNYPDAPRVKLSRFVGATSAFESAGTGRVSGICTSDNATKILKEEYKKREPRYAIITSDNQKNHSNILELFNAPDNINGDIIKVIIITPVGQVGLNLTESSYVSRYNSFYRPSQDFQGEYRAFRSTSHFGTMEQAMAALRFSPTQMRDSDIHVTVKVEPLACVVTPKPGEIAPMSIDEDVAVYTEGKDRILARLIRIGKRYAVNEQTQALRNMRPDIDQDYTPECDYMNCVYTGMGENFDFSSGDYDYSTYNVYYMDEIVDKIIKEAIIPTFRKTAVITVDRLFQEYHTKFIDVRYFYFAFAKMIDERIPVINRYGYESYVREDNGDFCLSHVYPRNELTYNYSSNFYTQNLITVQPENLSDIIRIHGQNHIENIWARIRKLPVGSKEFTDFISNLEQVPRMYLLEFAIQEKLEKNSNDPYVDAILKFEFKNYKILVKPEAKLNEEARTIEGISVNSTISISPPTIAIHKIYNPNATNASYGKTRQNMNVVQNIRVYENGIWRDTSGIVEDNVYRNIFSGDIVDKMEYCRQTFVVFGFFRYNDKTGIWEFVISDSRNVPDTVKIGSRSSNIGRVAETSPAGYLYTLILYLGRKYPDSNLGKMLTSVKMKNDNDYRYLSDTERKNKAISQLKSKNERGRNAHGMKIDKGGNFTPFSEFKTDDLEALIHIRNISTRSTVGTGGDRNKKAAVNNHLVLIILECFVDVDAICDIYVDLNPREFLKYTAERFDYRSSFPISKPVSEFSYLPNLSNLSLLGSSR